MTDTRLSVTIRAATHQLAAAGIDNPELDARLLTQHVLHIGHAEVLAQSERPLSHKEIEHINALIARRVKREPVARIMGEREFWGLSFGLNEATLEPRPDSETLIEESLKRIRQTPQFKISRVLDLGTGTGCLLLSLLSEMPQASGVGIDVAPRAVEQAQANAKRNHLSERSEFRIGNWFENVTERFDVIVSNPPYIVASDIDVLQPEVRDYDPRIALDGGADGLDIYRFLIPKLSPHLNKGGHVAFEVGQGQSAYVSDILKDYGFQNVTVHRDLGGIERCVLANFSD
jgi:release factor glutamine methyltransferase